MITFDDNYRLEDFGFRAYMEHEHEAVPSIKRKAIAIPGRPGTWNFGSEIGERHFNIPLKVTDHDRIELQRKQSAFVAFLFDEFGKPRPIKMTFDYEPDKHYTVEISSSVSPNNAIHFFRAMGLPLVASDPYKYSNELSEDVVWGSETITFEYDYLLGHEGLGGSVKVNGPQTIDLDVGGLAVQPIFEVDGTANNLKISANGYEFTLPNFVNTKWEVDFQKYLVWQDGTETMIEIRDFHLMPGRNKIKIEGNNIDINLRIKFRDKFN